MIAWDKVRLKIQTRSFATKYFIKISHRRSATFVSNNIFAVINATSIYFIYKREEFQKHRILAYLLHRRRYRSWLTVLWFPFPLLTIAVSRTTIEGIERKRNRPKKRGREEGEQQCRFQQWPVVTMKFH